MIYEFLKYIDCFGTKFNFYTDKNRKFYTPLGGIFSILAIFFAIIIFIFFNIEDFFQTNPITSTSVLRENYSRIKFGEEKIWIPWRIRDYNNRKINHTNLFYPIIYYYKGKYNENDQAMELSYDLLNYRLCNETSMVNRSDLHMITSSLDSLYCIDMEDLIMGGSWQSSFINYVEFDLYICEDGIDYDKSNIKCSSYEKIMNTSTDRNSFEMEFFYPLVFYQPSNKTTPIFVRYSNYFYHFSRYSNKIDRIYLQKYILKDDLGWISKDIKTSSYWGCSSLNGDSYATGNKRDLMNEGSSSRLYSLNIYLNADIVCYSRSYKKLFLIIADRLPIINVVFIFFSFIAKIFKVSSGNKKLTELLFENLKEKSNKTNKINNEPFNALKVKSKNNLLSAKKFSPLNNKNQSNNNLAQVNPEQNGNTNILNKSILGNTTNNNIIDASSSFIHLSPQHCSIKKNNIDINEQRRHSIDNKNSNLKFFKKSKNNENNLSNIFSNNSFNNKLNLNYGPIGVNNNNININIHNNLRNYESNISEDFSPNRQSSKINSSKKKVINEVKNNNQKTSKIIKPKKNYVKLKLFPYKYYLCSIFIKNVEPHKKSLFFTEKFINVYNFICQLFDVSSYLMLQKEFQMIKNFLIKGKYKALFENNQKINVNDYSFYSDIKECLDYKKFYILGRVKNANNKKINNI